MLVAKHDPNIHWLRMSRTASDQHYTLDVRSEVALAEQPITTGDYGTPEAK